MKLYFYARTLTVGFALLTLSNCLSENPGTGGGTNTPGDGDNKLVPPEQVLRAFENRYPDAKQAVWAMEDGYYVADFILNQQTASAWFAADGEWSQGKIPTPYRGEIEPIVSEAFSRTTYAKWEIKETYTLNRRELMSVYLVGVGNKEILSNLYFTQYGDLIKVIDDVHLHTDVPLTIPSALFREIHSRFADAGVVDMTLIDVINSEINVGLVENQTYLTAVFSREYAWIVSFWNQTPESLPPVVWNGFQESVYSELPLSRIRKMHTPKDATYLFYLINDGKTMIAEFNSLGQLSAIMSRNHTMAKYLLLR
jgi:hypothetical protein